MFSVIDIHAHLEELNGLDQLLQQACNVGVVGIITVGSNYQSNKFAVEISEKYRGLVYPALGIHPWNMDSSVNSAFEFIESNLDKAVGIGEIGLDYWFKDARKNEREKEVQRATFRRLLQLAKEHNKPVEIHSRGAWGDCLKIAEEEKIQKAVFHWYSGPINILDELLSKGYFISATPAVEYSPQHQLAIKNTPLNRIFLETDSPVAYKGIESTPADVIQTLDFVAKIKNKDKTEVAMITTKTAVEFFRLPPEDINR